MLDILRHSKTLALEGDKFAAKAETSTALRLEPLWVVGGTGLLALDRVSELTLLIPLTHLACAVRRERQDVCVAFVVQSCNLPVLMLGPKDCVVG